MSSSAPVEIEEEKCCVCKSNIECDTNKLLKCRKCSTIVHQSCYTNTSTPFGWMCDVCTSGAHPDTTICELCPFKGGAYKKTDTGLWVHCLCALWIPEITTKPDKQHGLVYNISKLDKDRFKLKCMACKLSKCGVCIQCSYGRCTAPIHPFCAIHDAKGFTHRVFKYEDYTVAEVFCAKHAESVKDPYKPKARPAASINDLVEEEEEEYENVSRHARRKSNDNLNGGSSTARSKLTMAHAVKFDPKRVVDAMGSEVVGTGNKMVDLSIEDGNATESEDDDDGFKKPVAKRTGRQTTGGKHTNNAPGSSKSALGAKSGAPKSGQGAETLTIPTMSEWPGQSEGEAMDLEHFWNVVSLHFPSTYSPEWIDSMQEVFRSGELFECDSDDELMQLPSMSERRDEITTVAQQLDGIWSSLSEKAKYGMIDIDKRCQLLAQIKETIEVLEGQRVPGTVSLIRRNDSSSNTATDSYDDAASVNDSQPPPAHTSSSAAYDVPPDVYFLDDIDYLTQKLHSFAVVDLSPTQSGLNIVKCIYDGDSSRFAVEMKVLFDDSNGASEQARMAARDVGAWSQVSLKDYNSSAHKAIVDVSLISRLVKTIIDDAAPMADYVWVGVSSVKRLDDKVSVHVGNRTIIPKEDDDLFARMIRTDQAAYKTLSRAVQSKINHLMTYDFKADSVRMAVDKKEWAVEERAYNNQQVWKNIVSTLIKGMRDQQADFNKAHAEEAALPASWAIQVEGRPAPPMEEEEENKAVEDIICMCCFDGSISDSNQILFCDGCNSAVHQSCYGVAEIPDGDFFCDRCRGIQTAVEDLAESDHMSPAEIRDMIKCCLCPHQHGGIKPTTDGRWVHLCCAMWSDTAVLQDMLEMAPVDLSLVPVQIPIEDAALVAIPAELVLDTSSAVRATIAEACTFCGLLGGLVRRCDAEPNCEVVFHPMCAWFHGMRIESSVTDPSFLGRDRGGAYPSGVAYRFCCDSHCPAEFQGQVREDQISLRTKYRISEADLEAIPGQNKRKRLKKAKKDKEGGRLTGKPQVKDLPPDVYDHRRCAICLSNFSDADRGVDAVKREAVEIKDDGEEATDHAAAPAPASSSASAAPSAEVPRKILSCSVCKISVHGSCCIDTQTYYSPSDPQWVCEACCRQESDLTCIFCPRKGGAFKLTTTGEWAHTYCARNVPGVVRITNEGLVESRSIPKESRKQKCLVCNRRNGVCMKCSKLGCPNGYFHPICGVRTGKICVYTRMGAVSALCPEHAPLFFKKHETEGWYDDGELDIIIQHLGQLSTIWDKLRLREKKKRDLNLCEKDLFIHRFLKELDKAKGRKSDVAECDLDDSFLNYSSSDDDDDDYEDYFSDLEGERLMLKQIYSDKWIPASGESVLVDGAEVSASFLKSGREIKLPKKVHVSVCGVKRGAKNASTAVSQKHFVKSYMDEQKKFIANYQTYTIAPPYDLARESVLCVKEILKLCSIADDAKFEREMRKRGVEVDLSRATNRAKRGAAGDGEHPPSTKKAAREAQQQQHSPDPAQKRRGRPPKAIASAQAPNPNLKAVFMVQDDEEEWDEDVVVKVDRRKRKPQEIEETVVEDHMGARHVIASKKKGYVLQADKPAQRAPYHSKGELLQLMSTAVKMVPEMEPRYPFDDVLFSRTLVPQADLLDPADLELFSQDRLPELERRISDIMQEIEEARIDENTRQLIPASTSSVTTLTLPLPSEPSSNPNPSSNREARRSSRGRQPRSRAPLDGDDDDEPGVQLIGEFLELPYSALPNYNKYVRRLLTFNELSRRYKSHKYVTMCSFVKDFYDMLNNGRNVTGEGSTTFKDTSLIAQLFEEAKRRSVNPVKRTDTKFAGANVQVTKLDTKMAKVYADTLNSNLKCCSICKASFDVQNLPDADSDHNWRGQCPSRCRFGWVCPGCICEYASTDRLLNRRIAVFWPRDQCFYGGTVDFYDAVSRRHRVCYDDGEWAFEDLSVEPNAFQIY